MPSLHLRGLTFAHTTAIDLLRDVDLDLVTDPAHPTPWIGVVGPNGAGKSTLLRLLAGHLDPTAGHVDVQASLPPCLVPQDAAGLTDDVRGFAGTWDGVAERLRSRLGLDPDDVHDGAGRRWRALSPGHRKRWQVATAVAARPDILLLDEPTNHLDGAARDLLVGLLRDFRGLGLIVSHDRTVLEQLTSRTVRVHRGTAELHAGAYGEASARWRQAEGAARADHDRAKRELRREQRGLADLRRDRHSAEAAPRRERRLAGARQPDAREAGRKAAQDRAEAALARRVGQQNARVARAERAADADAPPRELGRQVGFRHVTTGRRVLARVSGDVRHAGGGICLRGVDVVLRRGERVHLAGRNGAGKTTLIGALTATLVRAGEQVAALPQEVADPVAQVDRVRRLDPVTRGRLLGVVASLGVDPDRVLTTAAPSPGEVRKLALAHLLVGDTTVLVLDEPTNHLDLPSIERLEEALDRWPGALMLVTHDDGLAAATTSTVWHVGDGRVRVEERSPRRG